MGQKSLLTIALVAQPKVAVAMWAVEVAQLRGHPEDRPHVAREFLGAPVEQQAAQDEIQVLHHPKRTHPPRSEPDRFRDYVPVTVTEAPYAVKYSIEKRSFASTY